MSENVFAVDDFTEEEIYDYIDQRLNFYEGYASAKDATEADHQTSLTLWKTFIWLEQAGYDFWDQCWHESVRRFLWERSVGWNMIADDEWETFDREDDLILPKHMARRMQFHVRNRMRGVLGLDWLPESEYERVKHMAPVLPSKWLDYQKPEGRDVDLTLFDPEFPKVKIWLTDNFPDNIRILQFEINLIENGSIERFRDKYTPNGDYSYTHYANTYLETYSSVVTHLVDYYLDKNYKDLHEWWARQISGRFARWMTPKLISDELWGL